MPIFKLPRSMQKNVFISVVAGFLVLAAGTITRAQTYSNTVMSLNPVGYWPLNETTQPPMPLNLTATNLGSLGAVGDGFYGAWYQPDGNQWYLTNDIVQTAGATADGDKALNCQFAPGQYVILPRNTNGVANKALTINAPFSIETWIQVGTTAGRLGDIVSQGQVQVNAGGPNTNNPFYGGPGGPNWAGFELGQFSNFFFFSCYDTNAYNYKASELDSPHTLAVGQWVYLVVTFDGTHETMYTNGVQCSTKTVPVNGAGLSYVPDTTSPLMIGAGGVPPLTYGVVFTGTIDETAIYTNLLSPASMLTHYEAAGGTNATYGANYANAVLADNPLIYYRLDDPQSQTNAGYDSTTLPVANNYGSAGAAGNGAYQPGTTPGVAGPAYTGFGAGSKSVAINGWLGAVDVGNSNIPASLNPVGAVPMTVASWFQTGPADAPGRFQEMVGHSDSSYRLSLGQTAGDMHFNPGPGPELQFTSPLDVATNGFAFNDGQWHMIAGVSDGTNEYLYLDGALAKTNANATGINITGTTRDLLLGGDPQYTFAQTNTPGTIRNFDGQIAQVAFWTNALTGAQIQSLFDAAHVPPYLWQEPLPSFAVNAGQNVSIPVGARGSALAYQWYQNGLAIAGQTGASLSFSPITTNNAGTYFVIVTNSYGAVTSSVVNITVFGPPTISQQSLTQLEIFSGSSPTLHVTASGASPLSYQWSLGGVPINGATNADYTLTDITSSGTYSCAITNFLGTNAISPISVTVLSDPTAPFPVKVLADGAVAYFRLDEASGPTAFDYVGGNNGTYTNVTLDVPGYTSAHLVQSDPTETAAEFGDIPVINPNNDYVGNVPSYLNFGTPNGGNAEFTVEAWAIQNLYSGSGDAIVALGYGNGGEQFCLDTGGSPSGGLRFFVRNAAGTAIGASVTNTIVADGMWHLITGVCDEAAGHIYLYEDGVQLASGALTAGSGLFPAVTAPLSIGARQSANNGGTNYDFQFLGSIDDVAIYNKALSAAQVQSHFYAAGIAPTVQIQPSSLTTNQGATVTFTAMAQGSATLGYQWYDRTGTGISGQTNTTLTLTNLAQGQSGNYSVTVTNFYGSATASASLTVVQGAPQITADLQPTNVTAYAGDPVNFSIVASGSQPLYYQWYQDNVRILNATNASYSFAALQGTNSYYCAVTNIFSYPQNGGPTFSSTGTVVGVAVTTVNPTNFNSKLKITFAGYNRNETLSAFPVLVRLSANLNGFSYSEFASPTGGDLRFADASGTRELPYEIDQWNDSNGVSSVWVQLPHLSSTNDYIWAYWGNASDTTPPAYTTNGSVWVPASFLDLPAYDIVYHLKESGFPYFDSTLNHASTNGAGPAPLSGLIGNSEDFNGTEYLDSGTVNLDDAVTLSAWVNVSPSATSIQTIWANQTGGYGAAGFSLFVNFYQSTNQALLLDTGDGSNGSELSTAPNAVTYGQWHLVTAEINRTNDTAVFYVDGAAVPIVSGNPLVQTFVTNADLNLGRFTNNSLYFNGDMDEARIHAGNESSNWVWASYMTVASNTVFSAYSSVTNLVGQPVRITIQVSGQSVILTWPQGTLQSANAVNGQYNDVLGATSPYTNTINGTRQFYRVRVQ